jgi:arachidonate 5-lipoxygenase
MFALLAATGCSTEYMLEKVPSDFEAVAKDGSGGQFRSFARAARRRGMHPGQKLYDFLGSILEDTTGSADITFAQLFERCGRELCIPVTNVSRMMTEY